MSNERNPLYSGIRALVGVVSRVGGGVTIIGGQNIPREGAAIVAPNHVANIDPPYVSLITRRPMKYMAKEELFKKPPFAAFIQKLGAFPVKRGTADRAALRRAIGFLKDGRLVVIFPEGTRSEDGQLQEAEKGFALIARQTGAPIIPVAIEGTEKMLPKGASRPRRAPVRITIGQPMTAQEILAAHPAPDKDALAIIGEATMAAIAALMSEPNPVEKKVEKNSYRG